LIEQESNDALTSSCCSGCCCGCCRCRCCRSCPTSPSLHLVGDLLGSATTCPGNEVLLGELPKNLPMLARLVVDVVSDVVVILVPRISSVRATCTIPRLVKFPDSSAFKMLAVESSASCTSCHGRTTRLFPNRAQIKQENEWAEAMKSKELQTKDRLPRKNHNRGMVCAVF